MEKLFYILLILLLVFTAQSCELFVIKGKKIVIEEQSTYTQRTPIGVVTIFISELENDNELAASELICNADGSLLNAAQKYDISTELSRMKRFLTGRQIINQLIDTTSGIINVVLELENNSKARFATQSVNSLYYISSFSKE